MSPNQDYENPLLAVDCIIRYQEEIVLIYRGNHPEGWALPGGFVKKGETVEEAAQREISEETNLNLRDLTLWNIYSEPDRDPREHVVSICFTAAGRGNLKADTDAAEVDLFSPDQPWPALSFDHEQILNDYSRHQDSQFSMSSSEGTES